jgi:hypothetical protein
MTQKVDSEIIIEKVSEHIKKLGYNWFRVIEIVPPNGNKNWSIIVNVGVIDKVIKTIVFDKNGKFLEFK